MKRSKTSGFAVALPFLLPSIAGFLVFSLIPIIATLFISLTSWDGLSQLTLVNNFSGFMSKYFVGINNYIKIFEGREIYQVLLNTLKFVVLYIPLMLVASLCIAGILNSKVHGVGFFRVVYYIPVITSWVAGALIWRWVLNPQYGIMNAMLAVIGIHGPQWLQSPQWSMPAIVLASVWKDMGYFGLMLLGGLQGINREYYEAASIDGANKVARFFRITLPLLTPTIFFVLIISMINSFQIFPQVVIMTPDGGQFHELMPSAEGNNERSPWNIAAVNKAPEFVDEMRFWHNLRMNLLPYLYCTALECVSESRPMMRPLAYDFYGDPAVRDIDDQFMLGKSLLVAPMLEENAQRRRAYLPRGTWYDLFTGKKSTGGQIVNAGSKSRLPVYLRAGYGVALNLGAVKKLGSDVGNRVDSYCNLVFLLAGDEGSCHFKDDLGNDFTLRWEKSHIKKTGHSSCAYSANIIG